MWCGYLLGERVASERAARDREERVPSINRGYGGCVRGGWAQGCTPAVGTLGVYSVFTKNASDRFDFSF